MEFINRITKIFPVARIYLTPSTCGNTNFKELTFLLPNSGKLYITEARPLVNMVMMDHPQYQFRLFYLHEVKQALEQGSMVFYTICREEHLVYQSENSNELLSPPELTAKAVLHKARRNFEKELKKIAGFREGAAFYLHQGDAVMSTFMLHQVIELSYRAAELLVAGREKISHSIRNHQKFMRHYVPAWGIVFNEEEEKELKLLALLDEAYRSVRYETTYAVDQQALLFFTGKADLVQEQLAGLYELVVAQFTQNCLATEKEKSIPGPQDQESPDGFTQNHGNPVSALNEDLLQIILRKIMALVPVERIDLMRHTHSSSQVQGAYQSTSETRHHFDLLVIIQGPCDGHALNLQAILNQDKELNGVSLSLWVHSRKQVEEALEDNNRFFHEIFRSDKVLHSKPDGFVLPDYDHSKERQRNERLWSKRKDRAEALITAAENIAEDDSGVVQAMFLSQAMEQLCLGFIAFSIGYRPNQQSLSHLFALCRCINPAIDQVFPIARTADREIFDLMLEAQRNLRYRPSACIDPVNLRLLTRRCYIWLEKVDELAHLFLNS